MHRRPAPWPAPGICSLSPHSISDDNIRPVSRTVFAAQDRCVAPWPPEHFWYIIRRPRRQPLE
eukprot:15469946-Alexandrium_andersonii.AAC.1